MLGSYGVQVILDYGVEAKEGDASFDAVTEQFIEAIRPQISLYVWQRDQAENPPTPIDISSWNNHSVDVEAYTLAEAALESQLPAVQQDPEVTV